MSFANETPLDDVLKYIKQETAKAGRPALQIYVDPIGLQEAERSLNSTVTIDMEGYRSGRACGWRSSSSAWDTRWRTASSSSPRRIRLNEEHAEAEHERRLDILVAERRRGAGDGRHGRYGRHGSGAAMGGGGRRGGAAPRQRVRPARPGRMTDRRNSRPRRARRRQAKPRTRRRREDTPPQPRSRTEFVETAYWNPPW